jgi:3-methylfumaryl-CoA hydratase
VTGGGGDPAAAWVGRSRAAELTVDPWPAAALAAALGRDDPPGAGEALPPFWHQLYGAPVVRADETGPDGHERKGVFLPAVALPRRMWAGGRLTVHRPLLVGERARKLSTVRSVTPKQGRQGPLVFVVVEHRVETDAGVALVEEQDIVYREPAPLGGAAPPTRDEPGRWRRAWTPDAVLLFRYSALTYNGHRIHYDAPYARDVEGYRGLVVHGPLLATLMLDLLRRELPGRSVRSFAYRGTAPLIAGEELVAHGEPEGDARVRLWVTGPGRLLAMEGGAEVA